MSYHDQEDEEPFGILAIIIIATVTVTVAVVMVAGVYRLIQAIAGVFL